MRGLFTRRLTQCIVSQSSGAGGTGFIVVDALGQTEVGRGILAGMEFALIAMMIDRVAENADTVGAWID